MPVLFCGTFELDLSSPRVMGILNLTPDSFYDGGKYPAMDIQMNRAEQMLAEGAAIIDLGAVSTRPGAAEVSEQEEISAFHSPLCDFQPALFQSIRSGRKSQSGLWKAEIQ